MPWFPRSFDAATTAVVLAATAALVAAGCGQGVDRAAAIDSFEAANPEVTEAEAGCVVDRLTDRYGLDGLVEELEAGEADEAFTDAQIRDMFACGVEGDLGQQVAEQLVANGVDEADAPCVADTLLSDIDDDGLDVLLSGTITDDFMADFVVAMQDCGAIDGDQEERP